EQFVEQHFDTQGFPTGHGFESESNRAFYAMPFTDGDLVHHRVLDTTNALGYNDGILEVPQFDWLEDQLRSRSARYLSDDDVPVVVDQPGLEDRLVVVHAHHTLTTMSNDIGLDDSRNGADLERLLLRYPNVIMFVNGHTHKNQITPHQRPWPATVRGGFWE